MSKKKNPPAIKRGYRRRARRFKVSKIWANELQGDYQYLLPVENISEGGIFIRGRALNTDLPSQITLRLGKQTLKLQAQAVHDHVGKETLGTGYCFIDPTEDQTLSLRSFLRNLD